MLRLLSLLQTHRYWPGMELAGRLEVSERTLRRDVERLRELGYPVDATRGHRGGYQLLAGAALPPLLLEDDEAVAIALGLRAAADGSVRGIEDGALRALTKVMSVMPPGLRRRAEAVASMTVQPGRGPALDAVVLTRLAQVCRDHERVRFTYSAQSESDLAHRHVEPHSVLSLNTRWYFLAFDLDRHDWRTFRVDRISDMESARTRVPPRALPDGLDPVEFVRRNAARRPRRHEVRIVVRERAVDVAHAVLGWGRVDPTTFPGSEGKPACRITMATDDLSAVAWLLTDLDTDFIVEEPCELADLLHRVGERFTATR
ncbi:MAG: helix-turn-helix transcriptional regulator [Cumulibacter sp.]